MSESLNKRMLEETGYSLNEALLWLDYQYAGGPSDRGMVLQLQSWFNIPSRGVAEAVINLWENGVK